MPKAAISSSSPGNEEAFLRLGLGGDPVADIRNTRAVRLVIQQGHALDPGALLAQAGVSEAARALDAPFRTR